MERITWIVIWLIVVACLVELVSRGFYNIYKLL